ncbi:hypothetical protein ACMFMG_010418 [Clarireedia jacksonii]
MISRTGLGLLFLGGRVQTFITCAALRHYYFPYLQASLPFVSLLQQVYKSFISWNDWVLYSMFGWCAYSRMGYGQPNLKQTLFSTIVSLFVLFQMCIDDDEKPL